MASIALATNRTAPVNRVMNSRLFGPVLALFLAVVSTSTIQADDDIILNGNFSDGKTHWHGDGDVPDLGGSLVITLKPDKWTVVYQDFSAEATQVRLKITYSYSDDCTLATKRSPDQLVPPLDALGLEQATGMENSIGSFNLPGSASWMVLIASGGRFRGEHPVYPGTNETNPRTFSTTLTEWTRQFDREDLCLAFPPGTGTVTITEVKVIPPASTQ
jgi:hypothetical protein